MVVLVMVESECVVYELECVVDLYGCCSVLLLSTVGGSLFDVL